MKRRKSIPPETATALRAMADGVNVAAAVVGMPAADYEQAKRAAAEAAKQRRLN